MNYLVIALVLAFSLFFFFYKKIDLEKDKTVKIFSGLLFIVYLFRLFTTNDALNSVFNVLLFDIETPINAPDTWIFSQGMTVFIIVLRWLSTFSLIALVLYPYFKDVKALKVLGGVFGTVIGVLNLVFFYEHLMAFSVDLSLVSFKGIQYLIESALFLFIGINALLSLIKNKEFAFKLDYLLVVLGGMFLVMPQTILFNLFGYYGEVPDEFTASHVFVIIIPFALMTMIYLFMKKKPQAVKDALITFMAFAAFMQYFYMRRETLAALPLHLCNTAVVLLLFAVEIGRAHV